MSECSDYDFIEPPKRAVCIYLCLCIGCAIMYVLITDSESSLFYELDAVPPRDIIFAQNKEYAKGLRIDRQKVIIIITIRLPDSTILPGLGIHMDSTIFYALFCSLRL